MNAPQPGSREIVSGLVDVLVPALEPDAGAATRAAAREVSQILALEGLVAALAQLERLSGPARPVEADHLAERIARIVDLAVRAGDLSAFQAADRELAGLAAQLGDVEWSGPGHAAAPPVATWEVGETFADVRLEAAPEVARTRLTMNVASALRAAADWLGADENTRAVAAVHDSAITVTLAASDEDGIGPAGAVLAAVEGSLGHEPDGRWTLRVPRCAERPSFLLVRQGRFGFALPWHAVARLRMFAPHELDRLVEPRLDPLAALAPTTTERPAAMMALGLARAWFIADRIVWRIAAHPEESDVAGPFAGATRVVEVESGERYWVLEPAWLLRGVVPAETPPPPAPRLRSIPAPSDPAPAVAPAPEAPAPAAIVVPEPEAFAPEPEPFTPAPPAHEALAAAAERALETLRAERAAARRAAAERDARAAARETPPPPRAPQPDDAAAWVDVAFAFQAPPAPASAPPPAPLPPPPPAAAGPAAPPPHASSAAADAILFGSTPAFETEHAEVPTAPAARKALRRALIADDSLVARIFLGRLLEQRGWIVESVPDAAGLWNELRHGSWALVCADFALPDATGRSHVQRLVDHFSRGARTGTLVVLTRDEEEERIALEAGASLSLRKPFDAVRLDVLLAG